MESELNNRYVAVCDLLGFKARLWNQPLPEVLSKYKALFHLIRRRLKALMRPFPDSDIELPFFGYAIVSDTVLVWSAPIDTNSVASLLDPRSVFFDVCNGLIQIGIGFRMPFRVGVSFGEVCIMPEHSMFVGKPIAEAHLLEQSQNWIGGACHPSCSNDFNFPEIMRWGDVFEYEVPTKEGHRRLPALNWVRDASKRMVIDLDAQSAASPTAEQSKYIEARHFLQTIRQQQACDLRDLRRRMYQRRNGLSSSA